MSTMRSLRLTLTLALLGTIALLGACGTPTTAYEGRYAVRDGWVRGTVHATVSDAALPATLRPACATQVDTTVARHWVIVRHSTGRRERKVAAPALPAGALAVGTPVYVQAQGCARALALRTVAD